MKPKDQNYSKSRRLKNQIKAVVTNPYNVIVLVAIVLLTYLIVLPLLDMITTSFTLAQKDARLAGGAAGDFTLYYWQRLLGSSLTKQMLVQPLLNSLLIGVCVSFFAILLGSVLAWLMVRTDLPFKPFFSLAVIIPYMIPSWCKSQAWLTMFKTERIGGAPGFLMSLGINVPDWLAYGRSRSSPYFRFTITHMRTCSYPQPSTRSTPSLRKWARFRAPARRLSCARSRFRSYCPQCCPLSS